MNRRSGFVLKQNVRKVLKLSALFVIVFMVGIASVNLFGPKAPSVTEKAVYEELRNAGMTIDEGTITSVKVTTSASPNEGGSVTPSASIPKGTSITLNAVPASGYRFVGWKKNGSESYVSYSPSYITEKLSEDTVFTAEFEKQNTMEIVPQILFSENGTLRVSDEGGYVIGGGTLAEGEYLSLRVIPGNNDLYEFEQWYIIDGNTYQPLPTNKIDPIVGYKYQGTSPAADINLEDGQILCAAFRRYDGLILVTASMIPALGSVCLTKAELSDSEKAEFADNEQHGATVSAIADKNNNLYLYFGAYIPDTSSHNMASDSADDKKPKDEYQFTHINFTNKYMSGHIDPQDAGSGLVEAILDTNILVADTDVFVHYKAYDASFNYTCALATAAFPSEGGTTTGDMASTGSFSTTVRATPNEGYEFDHWEWTDPDTGQTMKSKEISLSFRVTGLITCKAFFRLRSQTVSVASISPGAGGYVKTGLGDHQYNQDVNVEIVPYEGYEFQSVSYTTTDGIVHTYDSPTFTIPAIKEDIFLNLVFKQTAFTVSAKPEPVKMTGDSSYNRVKLTSGDTVLETEEDGKAVEMELNSQGQITLEAIEDVEDGYRFVQWVGTDGSVSSANPYTPSSINDDVTYIAEFEKEKYKIRVIADPASYGDVFVGGSKDALSSLSEYEVKNGEDAYIRAEPKDGYQFLYWTNTAGTRLTSFELTLKEIKNDETYTAHFAGELELTIEASPAGYGEVQLDQNGYVTNSTTYKAFPGQEVTLSARPMDNTSYKFEKWADKDGNKVSDAPEFTVTLSESQTFTAVFVNDKYIIRTIADAAVGGTADVYLQSDTERDKRQTSLAVNGGEKAELVAEPNPGYEFLYWTSSSGTKYYDRTVKLDDVQNDETFTAHFSGNIEVIVEPSPAGYGQVSFNQSGYLTASSAYRVTAGESFTLSARPLDSSSYKFEKWVMSDGSESNDPDLIVSGIYTDRTYTAVFVNDKYFIQTSADPVIGGTAFAYRKDDTERNNPKTNLAVNGGENVILVAEAESGYDFRYWTDSNGAKYYDAELKLDDVENDETFTAHFTGSYEVTLETSPASYGLASFNGNDYISGSAAYYVHQNEPFTLSAKPMDNSSYKFEKWVLSDGTQKSDADLTITGIDSDMTYTAVFVNDKYIIRTIADAANGGTAYAYRKDDTGRVNPSTSLAVNGGEDVVLVAEENTGYEFLYWTSSTGTKYYEKELELNGVENDETFTAHFTGSIRITIEPSPSGYGQVQFNESGFVTSSSVYYVNPGDDFTVSAEPLDSSSYRFVKWVLSDGTEERNAKLDVKDIQKDMTYTAVFAKDRFMVTVIADPESGGTADVYGKGDDTSVRQTSVYVNTGGEVHLTAKANEADGYEFLYWTNTSGTVFYDADPVISGIGNDETFTAHFRGEIEITVEASPAGYGQVQFNENGYVTNSSTYYVKAGDTFSVSAKPLDNSSYRFQKWVLSDGTELTDAELIVSDIQKDMTYTAVFVNDKYTIHTVADPVTGGSADVYLKGAPRDKHQTSLAVNGGADVVILAKANEGYEFLYWTSSLGTKYYDSEVEIDGVENDETFTAHFGGTLEITVEPSPAGYGQVQFNTGGYVTNSVTYRVSPDEKFTLTAKPLDNSSYKFVKWVDSDGNEYRVSELKDFSVQKNTTFTAVFAEDNFTLKTIADPANGGTANIYEEGDDESIQQTVVQVKTGDPVKLIAKPADGYDFLYWTGSTGTRYNDAVTVIDDVGNDEVFTAHFYRRKIKVTIDGYPEGSALFKLNDNPYVSERTTYEVDGDSNITLTAEPTDATKYEFVAWEDNYGNQYAVNPLQITEVTKDIVYTAIFNPKDQEIGIVLRASPAEGGELSKILNADGSADISAKANPGFLFTGWSFNGEIITAEADYHISEIIDGSVYTAVFEKDPDYKPKSDIPYEKTPDISRKDSSLSYSFTREILTGKAKSLVMEAASRYANYTGVPNSYAAYSSTIANTSGNYAWVNDRSALLLADELVTTRKESISSWPVILDGAEEMAKQFTENKFGTRYQNEILAVKQVNAGAKFAESSHTFLMKNTGAKFKDNVYILYGSPNGFAHGSGIPGFDWVTCFVDEAGTLRFTIPSFHSSDYFIVVKTWPE